MVESDCDALLGSGAANGLYRDDINTGVWGVGLSATLAAATFDALETSGADPADSLGGVFSSDSDIVASSTWTAYANVYEVNDPHEVQTERGLRASICAADADRLRSNPRIPTTPITAVYAVDTFTLFVC